MIGYVGVDEQVDKDFHRALLRASLHRLRDRVFRRSAQGHALSFEEARGALTRWNQVYWGMRTVEVAVYRIAQEAAKRASDKHAPASPPLVSTLLLTRPTSGGPKGHGVLIACLRHFSSCVSCESCVKC
jgi:hypothetical protein